MKHKKTMAFAAFLLLGLGGLKAQNSTVATGGDAIGNNGSSSYSVGQLVTSTNTGSNGSLAQGVQQPFDISIVTAINEFNQGIELSVFPNPTTRSLNLEVADNIGLSYQLYNLQGVLVRSDKVVSSSTTIPMEELIQGTYLLKVVDKNQPVQTFEIIKN